MTRRAHLPSAPVDMTIDADLVRLVDTARTVGRALAAAVERLGSAVEPYSGDGGDDDRAELAHLLDSLAEDLLGSRWPVSPDAAVEDLTATAARMLDMAATLARGQDRGAIVKARRLCAGVAGAV